MVMFRLFASSRAAGVTTVPGRTMSCFCFGGMSWIVATETTFSSSVLVSPSPAVFNRPMTSRTNRSIIDGSVTDVIGLAFVGIVLVFRPGCGAERRNDSL